MRWPLRGDYGRRRRSQLRPPAGQLLGSVRFAAFFANNGLLSIGATDDDAAVSLAAGGARNAHTRSRSVWRRAMTDECLSVPRRVVRNA